MRNDELEYRQQLPVHTHIQVWSSDMPGSLRYQHYAQAVAKLAAMIGHQHPLYTEVLHFQHRLMENIHDVTMYNDTPERRSDRTIIIGHLNELALRAIGMPFLALIDQEQPSPVSLPEDRMADTLRERSVGGSISIHGSTVTNAVSGIQNTYNNSYQSVQPQHAETVEEVITLLSAALPHLSEPEHKAAQQRVERCREAVVPSDFDIDLLVSTFRWFIQRYPSLGSSLQRIADHPELQRRARNVGISIGEYKQRIRSALSTS